jgi:hypothetical protein
MSYVHSPSYRVRAVNIFVLDSNPIIAATYQVDRHIVKMPTETAQMLCIAHTITKSGFDIPRNWSPRGHWYHPCSKWVRESLSNYYWLVLHGLALCETYKFRYNKSHHHASRRIIVWAAERAPPIPDVGLTAHALAVPDYLKSMFEDEVEIYREYYRKHKQHLAKWRNRQPPEWFNHPIA